MKTTTSKAAKSVKAIPPFNLGTKAGLKDLNDYVKTNGDDDFYLDSYLKTGKFFMSYKGDPVFIFQDYAYCVRGGIVYDLNSAMFYGKIIFENIDDIESFSPKIYSEPVGFIVPNFENDGNKLSLIARGDENLNWLVEPSTPTLSFNCL